MTKATNRNAAALLDQIADSFERGEYGWGKRTFYRTAGDGLRLCAVGAARFEIAGKPREQARRLARNEPGPRQYDPAFSMLIGILTGENRETFEIAAAALIAVDPRDRVDHVHSMAEFKVTTINDSLDSSEQAIAWIRRAARYAETVGMETKSAAPV